MPLVQLKPLNFLEANWAVGRDNETRKVFDPATLNVLATFPGMNDQGVDDAVAVVARAEWRRIPPQNSILFKFKALPEAHASETAQRRKNSHASFEAASL